MQRAEKGSARGLTGPCHNAQVSQAPVGLSPSMGRPPSGRFCRLSVPGGDTVGAASLERAVNPRLVPLATSLALLTGCFKPFGDLETLDYSSVTYENDLLEVEDAVVTTFEVDLVCPDGLPARVLTVAREGLEQPQAVAVVLHGGAFDVASPDDVVEGVVDPSAETYRAASRLTQEWGVSKVWELLGNRRTTVDAGESHEGALPAALTNADTIQVYPANCWGDLWMGRQTLDNDGVVPEGEDGSLRRDGLTLAAWAVRMVVDGDFAARQDFSLPLADTSDLSLVALGSGARGAGALLAGASVAEMQGLLLDSPVDALSPLLAQDGVDARWVDGLLDIYGFGIDDWETDAQRDDDIEALRAELDGDTLATLANDGLLPSRSGMAWSSIDPQVPTESAAPLAATLEAAGAWVVDSSARAHIQLNGDAESAALAVAAVREGAAAQGADPE